MQHRMCCVKQSGPTDARDDHLQVGKQSKAAMSMCLWVRAMDTYATVYRIVEPKRQALAAAQAALDASNAILAEKQAQLKATREKVAALQRQLADTQKELASLQFQVGMQLNTLSLCFYNAVLSPGCICMPAWGRAVSLSGAAWHVMACITYLDRTQTDSRLPDWQHFEVR